MAHELKSLFDKLTFLGEPYNSFIEIEAEPSYLIFVTGDVSLFIVCEQSIAL